MKLPKTFTTVTKFSKTLALIMLILLPVAGFYLGRQYQATVVTPTSIPTPNQNPTTTYPLPLPTLTPEQTLNWKTYNKDFPDPQNRYPSVQIKYPKDWSFSEKSLEGSADIEITFKNKDLNPTVILSISSNDFSTGPFPIPEGVLDCQITINNGISTCFEEKNMYDSYYFPKDHGFAVLELISEDNKIIFNQILSTFKFTN